MEPYPGAIYSTTGYATKTGTGETGAAKTQFCA